MQKHSGQLLFSASDLVAFLECEHLTTLDLTNLETPLVKAEDDDHAILIQTKGMSHEAAYLDKLKQQGLDIVDISQAGGNLEQRVAATTRAMQAGASIIYQATLLDKPLVGHADFLRRTPLPSKLGNFSYEVLDTKLARSPKTKFILQLAFYSALISKIQGRDPVLMHLVLGDMREENYRFADYSRYFAVSVQRFLERVSADDVSTYPEPCAHCDICAWRDLCEQQRMDDDHLCQVANIRKTQIKKLRAQGVNTMAQLAQLPPETQIPKLDPQTLNKIRGQAALQYKARKTGQNHFELLTDQVPGTGFNRLPLPDPGDLFFDMEGDPLEDGGLEYLFGLYYFEQKQPLFKTFWAHNRQEEKKAFEQFMDFVTARLKAHPQAHIYHYAAYEESALKRLMSLHGTRESEVDNLLRAGKLIDLYKVVRESIRVSEPSYSIKNLEHFYLESRGGEVTNAGASIVFYERFKETGDQQLLKEIEDYNFDDVRSTYELRQWLLTLRPADLPWANSQEDDTPLSEIDELNPAEQALLFYREQLIDTLPADRTTWGPGEHKRELTFFLLDFHRRAAKPQWWAMFERQTKPVDELLEDIECLAGVIINPKRRPIRDKRSLIVSGLFPEQETKLKTGDSACCVETLANSSKLEIDEDAGKLTFRYGLRNPPLPERFTLGPSTPINTNVITGALYRFADSLIAGAQKYAAAEAILEQTPPVIKGKQPNSPIIDESKPALPQIIKVISRLESSYVFIQGPPGSGKTYTGSRVIVDLIRQGFRVAIASNSHKAINNLLHDIEAYAESRKIEFQGAKKYSSNNPDSKLQGKFIEDVAKKDDVSAEHRLVAGTAWLFADQAFDQDFDFLFVDEAGQVALANLIAMATCAKNVVLLGDQMQLGQPTQGVHPGRSGESSLEYLLNGLATIPPERGIFLQSTWRMHPKICRFISEAVYDGRLQPETQNTNQVLVLNAQAHPELIPAGIKFLPVMHDGCSQRSTEEAELIRDLVDSLLTQEYRDKEGKTHPISLANLLVVTPYNMQVNLLKKMLPPGSRIGTVDKFQGQQAEVVIISMATSSGEYLPRFISFLYSKNRLNVALSRAKSLAILVASPELLTIKCSTPEEMALVNTLCWVQDYSRSMACQRQ